MLFNYMIVACHPNFWFLSFFFCNPLLRWGVIVSTVENSLFASLASCLISGHYLSAPSSFPLPARSFVSNRWQIHCFCWIHNLRTMTCHSRAPCVVFLSVGIIYLPFARNTLKHGDVAGAVLTLVDLLVV